MRNHNKALCSLVAQTVDCPGPIFEFGAYQVDGQEGFADLRTLFPGRKYVGCDMRPGPGVDRVEDVTAIGLPDASAGTVLCIETFEHVFEVRRGFDEVFRLLKPGGVFVVTSPLNFRIHGYPDDYWRMTPSCLGRLIEPYAARLSGYQGYHAFPHTVMGVAIKAPIPTDAQARLEKVAAGYQLWLEQTKASLPITEKMRRRVSQFYRSKGERRQIASYYAAEFTIDVDAAAPAARKPGSGIPAMAAR
jgi:SAM-dependent methyltransferase